MGSIRLMVACTGTHEDLTQVDTCLKSDLKSQESPQLEVADLKSDRAHTPCSQVWLEAGEPDWRKHRRPAFYSPCWSFHLFSVSFWRSLCSLGARVEHRVHGVLPKSTCAFFYFCPLGLKWQSSCLEHALRVLASVPTQSHLSFCVQASKHTAKEASASSAFFDELIPQNMTPWEIPTTEGTPALGERSSLHGSRWAQSFWSLESLILPVSHLKFQILVGLFQLVNSVLSLVRV